MCKILKLVGRVWGLTRSACVTFFRSRLHKNPNSPHLTSERNVKNLHPGVTVSVCVTLTHTHTHTNHTPTTPHNTPTHPTHHPPPPHTHKQTQTPNSYSVLLFSLCRFLLQ